MCIILRNLRCRILYFWAFFCPKENIIQISYQKSSRAEVRSEYASEILNLFTYCKKLFFFFPFLATAVWTQSSFMHEESKNSSFDPFLPKVNIHCLQKIQKHFHGYFCICHRINYSTYYRLLLDKSTVCNDWE